MSTVRLVGNDTIKINDRLISDLPHGTVAELTFPNEMATVKTGKSGNVIYSSNVSGRQAQLVLKVLRGGADDKYLNSQIRAYDTDPTTFVLMTGEVVKVIGDGTGKIVSDTYVLTGGVFTKQVEVQSNVEGDVEQAVSSYQMMFAVAPRAIG